MRPVATATLFLVMVWIWSEYVILTWPPPYHLIQTPPAFRVD